MIIETPGTCRIRIASARIAYNVADGIVVRGTVLSEAGRKPLPDGLVEVEVTSPAGWLHYDEIGGVHCLKMGDAPVIERIAPDSAQSFAVTASLMGGSDG